MGTIIRAYTPAESLDGNPEASVGAVGRLSNAVLKIAPFCRSLGVVGGISALSLNPKDFC
jgi:hypothetical protein